MQRLLVSLLLMITLGGVVATTAHATVEAPHWSIEGISLPEGGTHFITAKAYKAFKLRTLNVNMECTTVKLKEGSLLGSSAGNTGKNTEVLEFSTCKVAGKAGGKTIEKCDVIEPIVSNPVESELVLSEKAEPAKEKGSLLTLFEPFSGTTLATLKFKTETGGNCPPETKVTGRVAGEVFTDPNKPPELGTLVSLESGSKEATSWLLNFPATQPKNIVRIINGEAKEEANPGLDAFAEEATLEGTTLLSLANEKREVEEASWGFEFFGGISVSPQSLTFRLVVAEQDVTVSDTSSSKVKMENFALGGAARGGFSINDTGEKCEGKTIGPGIFEKSKCIFKIKLTNVAAKAANLTVTLKIEPGGPTLKPVVTISNT